MHHRYNPSDTVLLNSVADVLAGKQRIAENSAANATAFDFTQTAYLVSKQFPAGRVGDLPPAPPTLRARIGRFAVNAIRRVLFWYTEQVRQFEDAATGAAAEHRAAIEALSNHFNATTREFCIRADALASKLDAANAQIKTLEAIVAALREQGPSPAWRSALVHELEARFQSLTASVDLQKEQAELARHQLDRRLEQVTVESEQIAARVEPLVQSVTGLQSRTDAAETSLNSWVAEFDARSADVLSRVEALSAKPTMSPEVQQLFQAHADVFRGGFDDIRTRLEHYLPVVEAAYRQTGQAPAVDLASGRGEWLGLLHGAGIRATGVEQNGALVVPCQERGLDVVQSDLFEHLRSLETGSQSLVSSFHIIEHLSFPAVLELLTEAFRVLAPSGILVLETPNPRNLFVSTYGFYLDPTHQKPLPAELMRFLLETHGFVDVVIDLLSPYPESFRLPEAEGKVAAFLNENFFGPQDMGAIGRKPAKTTLS